MRRGRWPGWHYDPPFSCRYREYEGTWFSVKCVLTPSGRYTVQYDWKDRPDFGVFPGPDQSAVEQERFPRGAAHLPAWFKESLAQAR